MKVDGITLEKKNGLSLRLNSGKACAVNVLLGEVVHQILKLHEASLLELAYFLFRDLQLLKLHKAGSFFISGCSFLVDDTKLSRIGY